MTSPSGGTVPITSEADVIAVRRRIREVAGAMGFGLTDVTRIVTAVSELTRNIFLHAGGGEVRWVELNEAGRKGIEIVFEDQGPGIADVEQALEHGYTSGGGLGMGLSGSKRLMDELVVASAPGEGTRVTARKWLR